MRISVAVDSRAYLHSGGTKYYRILSVSANTATGKSVHALITNYGPYKAAKGDLAGHRPKDGGTSAIEYFDNPTSLANKLNSEAIRRRGRGYDESIEHRQTLYEGDLTQDEADKLLRDRVGITNGQWLEILAGLGLPAPETGTTPDMGDVLAKARADLDGKLVSGGRRMGKSTAAKTFMEAKAAAAAPAPEPERDRGPEWGSW